MGSRDALLSRATQAVCRQLHSLVRSEKCSTEVEWKRLPVCDTPISTSSNLRTRRQVPLDQTQFQPPSTMTTSPVMKLASSLSRKAITFATSAGSAFLAIGTRVTSASRPPPPLRSPGCFEATEASIGVSISPGATALTRTCLRPVFVPCSLAAVRVREFFIDECQQQSEECERFERPTTPALDAEYAALPRKPFILAIDEALTMLPPEPKSWSSSLMQCMTPWS